MLAARAWRPGRGAVLAAVGFAVLLACFWTVRWSGLLPFGSDNDEYVMVAEALRAGEGPLVAGVEGTKYPLGYPAVLALLASLGLPLQPASLALNVLLVGVAVGGGAAIAWRHGAVAAVAAAAYLATGWALWSVAANTTADVALTATLCAGVAVVAFPSADSAAGRRRLLALTALAAVAATMKTVGIGLGLAATVGLLLDDDGTRARSALAALWARARRLWTWAPASAALAVTAAHAVVLRGYPEHATGYAATFWLADPYDAAGGHLDLLGVAGRAATRTDFYWDDLARALVGPSPGRWLAIALALALLAAGVWALRHRGWFALAYLGAFAVALVAWPYTSFRFGMPFLPIAAAGVGWLAAWIVRWGRGAGLAVVAAALAVTAVLTLGHLRALGEAERAELAELHAGTEEAAAWLQTQVASDETLVGFDYREMARRLDQPVLPLRYTSDTRELWAASGGRGADWLVDIPELYPRRTALRDELLSAYPDRFELAWTNDVVEVYRITR